MEIHDSWKSFLRPYISLKNGELSDVFTLLKTQPDICPKINDIFKVFRMPKDTIRVVWVFQDPYPNPQLATGIALAVPKDKTSPSLEVIKKELSRSYNTMVGKEFNTTLSHWEDQGVFLLNSALTCQAFKPNSHTELWKGFISAVLRHLNEKPGLIYVFSGKVAQTFLECVSEENSYVLSTYHPAADKHQRDKTLFVGSNVFIDINKLITRTNGESYKIHWLKNKQ